MSNAWAPLFRAPCAVKQSRSPRDGLARMLLKTSELALCRSGTWRPICARGFISSTHPPPLSPNRSIACSTVPRNTRPNLPSSSRHFHQSPSFKDQRPTLWTTFRDFLQNQLKDEIAGGPRYDGPRFRSRDLSQEEIDRIFGPGIDVEYGNRVLRHMHQRRKEGQVEWNPQVPRAEVHEKMERAALAWLRVKYPIDERAAYQARRKREEAAIQDVIVADAERLGIYKPNSSLSRKVSPYGKSVLDELQEHNRQRAKKEEKEQEKKAKEQMKALAQRLDLMKQNTEIKRRELSARAKYYQEKGQVSNSPVIPDMSISHRLVPAYILGLVIVVASFVYADFYTFPSSSARIFPDLPPAAATVLGLIALNTAVLIAWRIPPLWKTLNTYFISVPASPHAASILGSMFSHQGFQHWVWNMVGLWILGTRLHDQVGRGNFLAIYMSTGIISALASLTVHVMTKNLVVSSLGASGAVCGILAALCVLNANKQYTFFFIPPDFLPDWVPNIPSPLVFLCAFIATELYLMRRSLKTPDRKSIDHFAHLGGYLSGAAVAVGLKWRYRRRGKWEEMKRSEAPDHRRLQLMRFVTGSR
ncbi:MAG: hypothetical protein M1823_001657 [Watsoniomyces obsoletus]|nr:MAG: hypothetical protein M1823_001657 [Watsoniomyces obsoletus]